MGCLVGSVPFVFTFMVRHKQSDVNRRQRTENEGLDERHQHMQQNDGKLKRQGNGDGLGQKPESVEGNHAQRRKLEDDRVFTENVAEQADGQGKQFGKLTDQVHDGGKGEDVEKDVGEQVGEGAVKVVQQVIFQAPTL
jgi:hypothetical protein